MIPHRITLAVCLFFLGLFPAAFVRADTRQYPLLSVERLTIGARAELAWYSGNADGPVQFLTEDVQKEIGIGIVGAYALTSGEYPTALVGGSLYATDSKFLRSWIGVNVRLFAGEGVR